MEKVIIVKYGEIALRGNNRGYYEHMLITHIRRKIDALGDFYIINEYGRLIIEVKGNVNLDKVLNNVITTMGVVEAGIGLKIKEQNIDIVKDICLKHIQERCLLKDFTFKVNTRRVNKEYKYTSIEFSKIIGEHILNNIGYAKVDVKNPEVILNVEIRKNIYIYSYFKRGLGGLPVGSSGKGMLLLSGGIDSPVAGFTMAKRGVLIDSVYFHSPPYTSERAKEKVIDIAKCLSKYALRINLNIVSFTEIQVYLKNNVPEEKLTLFLKIVMLKIADRLAFLNDCQCLITGDSVGQVSSQTLHSLQVLEGSTSLPIIRPLAGMDKVEIISLANKIKTYDISIQPYEDCCTLFVAKHPEIKPRLSEINKIENSLLKLDDFVNNTINSLETIKI